MVYLLCYYFVLLSLLGMTGALSRRLILYVCIRGLWTCCECGSYQLVCVSCIYVVCVGLSHQFEHSVPMLCLLGGLTAAVTLSAREYISMSVMYLVGSLEFFCFRWLVNKTEETLPKFS